VIPDLDVLRAAEEEPGVEGPPGVAEAEPGVGAEGPGGPTGPNLIPLFEEISIQCAGYVSDKENEDFRIFGSEEGDRKIGLTMGDIVYLNRGTRDGIKPGDKYYIQERDRKIPGHGWYISRTGWLNVLAVQENTAQAEIIQPCKAVHVNSYLKPFEQIPVPLVPVQDPVMRLDPETGQNRGKIVASHDEVGSMGRGYLLSLDLGEEDGVIPGNIFTVYRYVYSNAPRKVLGEAAVLTVQRKTSTAIISFSYDYVTVGDLVELK
jgi:hypothetical protein